MDELANLEREALTPRLADASHEAPKVGESNPWPQKSETNKKNYGHLWTPPNRKPNKQTTFASSHHFFWNPKTCWFWTSQETLRTLALLQQRRKTLRRELSAQLELSRRVLGRVKDAEGAHPRGGGVGGGSFSCFFHVFFSWRFVFDVFFMVHVFFNVLWVVFFVVFGHHKKLHLRSFQSRKMMCCYVSCFENWDLLVSFVWVATLKKSHFQGEDFPVDIEPCCGR